MEINKQLSVDDIIKQLEVFEKTIAELSQNVSSLKAKFEEKKSTLGEDMSKWPLPPLNLNN